MATHVGDTDNYFHCPSCGQKARLKHSVSFAHKVQLYYGCNNDGCRHHFQVLRLEGALPQIVAESPRRQSGKAVELDPTTVAAIAKRGEVLAMGCPSCGRYGPIKMTEKRDGGAETWRRHKCPTCGPYFTCEDADGVSVHRRMKSRIAVEV